MLQKHIGGSSSITQSEMLVDLLTGTQREVDVCIRDTVAGHEIVISLECADHKRPKDVTWVETMKTKHDNLPTHSLVLVSNSGFTTEALKKAKLYGIATVVPGEVTDSDAATIVARLKARTFSTNQLHAKVVKVSVNSDAGEPQVVERTRMVYTGDGQPVGTMYDIVDACIRFAELPPIADAEKDLTVPFALDLKPFQMSIDGAAPEEVFLQSRLSPNLTERIARILIEGTRIFSASNFPMRFGEFRGVAFGAGEATVAGKRAVMVVTAEGGIEKFSLKVIEDRLGPI